MRALDRIDRNILRILQENGRISNVELARQIHLSATPCLERVRRLENDGYITGYRADLDAKQLDLDFVAFVTVSVDRINSAVFDSFATQVKALPEVVECHMVGGGFDYLLMVRVKDMEAYRRFLGERLSTLPQVMQTHSYFVMEKIVSTSRLPIGD